MEKATCGWCGKEVLVRKDGLVAIHRGEKGTRCEGSEQLPAKPNFWKALDESVRRDEGRVRDGAD